LRLTPIIKSKGNFHSLQASESFQKTPFFQVGESKSEDLKQRSRAASETFAGEKSGGREIAQARAPF
jgi:hypothetical protein